MNLRRIIKIEEVKKFKKPNGLCIKNKDDTFYLFTDLATKSSGIISKRDLSNNYEKMVGFSSDGKQLYMQKLKNIII